MKPLLITLSLTLLKLISLGQSKPVEITTFFSIKGFASFHLLICSDNNFYTCASNCTEADISKGKWTEKNGKIYLTPDKIETAIVNASIESGIIESDTVVTFEVLDCYQKPITGYRITFFDKDMKGYNYQTNDSGKLSVQKNTFVAYLTKDDISNIRYPIELTSAARFLWEKYSKVILTLNYPSFIITQRSRYNIREYKKECWLKTKKGLSLLNDSKFSLKKLQ
ncbi:MAG: hypothetical protein J0I41_05300 [Filimonas sp.]|nr:hypothetical protein [Filimonas sp.]